MITLLLFLIFATLVLYFVGRFANAVIDAAFWCVVFAVKLPWRIGVFSWRAVSTAQRFVRWCESRYVATERRARGM